MELKNLIPTEFSGCISIIENENVLFQGCYGYADLSNEINNELDTKFPTASAGKVFVSVGILQLIERGLLHFNDTIGDLLDFDLNEIDGNITIKQLLNHTSGIPDYFDESSMSDYSELWKEYPNYKIRTSSDLIPLFIHKPMMYPKGTKFQYNNTGFVVLGLIIEKVTGQLFDEFLRENIFIPSGMYHTGYYELDRLPAKCANAYIYDKQRKEYYTNIYSVDVKGTGAGGAFTTVLDIDQFWFHLLSGKLISKATLTEMLRVQSHNNHQFYGLGIWLDKTTSGTYTPYFEGCDPGVSFISSFDIEKNRNITIVSNFGCNVWELRNDILKAMEK
ncbi:MAG: serine hydrolase domain-containing protein [Bacillaceae bacterium]